MESWDQTDAADRVNDSTKYSTLGRLDRASVAVIFGLSAEFVGKNQREKWTEDSFALTGGPVPRPPGIFRMGAESKVALWNRPKSQ
jgi:hypothetical protein